ncbi:hypothetical protein, partial [Arthrobacter sp. Hiyo1]|uniref:hypothetical protein n=1 Tax=Arthrobacter sp. Hiyo1 TaxID=1588020 RepID=UPI000A48CD22
RKAHALAGGAEDVDDALDGFLKSDCPGPPLFHQFAGQVRGANPAAVETLQRDEVFDGVDGFHRLKKDRQPGL